MPSWTAKPRRALLRTSIEAALAQDPNAAVKIADDWVLLALCERDAVAADRALAALGDNTFGEDAAFRLSAAFGEGLAALLRKDPAAAQAAFTKARAEKEESIQGQPEFAPTLSVLGLIDAFLGRKKEALRQGRRAVELLPLEKDSLKGAGAIVYLAIIAAWSGEKDLALENLEVAAKIPWGVAYGRLRLHPFWDPLRGDPRFESVVASLAL